MSRLAAIGSNLPEETVSTGVNSGDTAGRSEAQLREQLDLRFDGSSHAESAWALMLTEIRHIVDVLGLKQVAFDLDCSPSYLSHCLNERERHNVPGRWIPYFVLKAKSDDLAAIVAMLRGRGLKPRVEMTPQQKLDALLGALGEQLGPEMRALLMKRAFDPK